MMEMSSVEQLSSTLAGVVAVDGGTPGLDVSFGAFLATILGLFIPVVFLVTLYIQSEAQGTATTFRDPDSAGGTRFDEM
jgi:photosystem II PsbM protein